MEAGEELELKETHFDPGREALRLCSFLGLCQVSRELVKGLQGLGGEGRGRAPQRRRPPSSLQGRLKGRRQAAAQRLKGSLAQEGGGRE